MGFLKLLPFITVVLVGTGRAWGTTLDSSDLVARVDLRNAVDTEHIVQPRYNEASATVRAEEGDSTVKNKPYLLRRGHSQGYNPPQRSPQASKTVRATPRVALKPKSKVTTKPKPKLALKPQPKTGKAAAKPKARNPTGSPKHGISKAGLKHKLKVQSTSAKPKPKAHSAAARHKTKAPPAPSPPKHKSTKASGIHKLKTQNSAAKRRPKVQNTATKQKPKAPKVSTPPKQKSTKASGFQKHKNHHAPSKHKPKVQNFAARHKPKVHNAAAKHKPKASKPSAPLKHKPKAHKVVAKHRNKAHTVHSMKTTKAAPHRKPKPHKVATKQNIKAHKAVARPKHQPGKQSANNRSKAPKQHKPKSTKVASTPQRKVAKTSKPNQRNKPKTAPGGKGPICRRGPGESCGNQRSASPDRASSSSSEGGVVDLKDVSIVGPNLLAGDSSRNRRTGADPDDISPSTYNYLGRVGDLHANTALQGRLGYKGVPGPGAIVNSNPPSSHSSSSSQSGSPHVNVQTPSSNKNQASSDVKPNTPVGSSSKPNTGTTAAGGVKGNVGGEGKSFLHSDSEEELTRYNSGSGSE